MRASMPGNFFEPLGRLGPTEILSLEGEDAERIGPSTLGWTG
jgi:hypothetical protein